MPEQYADKRGPLITVMWPGYDRCDEEPLRGIFHSARDGTTEFEFVSTRVSSDESASRPGMLVNTLLWASCSKFF